MQHLPHRRSHIRKRFVLAQIDYYKQMEEDSGANLKDSMQSVEGSEKQDKANYERLRHHMTHSVWHDDLQLAEIVKLKGSFFKNMGFSKSGIMYLYPEEVQHLAEMQQVYLERDGQVLDREGLYNLVLQSMPHACYLAYLKLKNLKYIVVRHSTQLRCFTCDGDVYEYLVAHPSSTLLDALVSFNIHAYDAKLFKRNLPETTPTSYVVVMSGLHMLSPRIMLKVLEEARGVPVMFAIMLPSGNIVFEEFTDATVSLNWKTDTFKLVS